MIEKATGVVVNVTSYAAPVDSFTDGMEDTNYLYKTVTDNNIINSYYNFSTNSFLAYPAKPAGDFYNWQLSAWVFDSSSFTTAMRVERDRRLKETDWTQLADIVLTTAERDSWNTYRQTLRDVPSNLVGTERSLEDINWP